MTLTSPVQIYNQTNLSLGIACHPLATMNIWRNDVVVVD